MKTGAWVAAILASLLLTGAAANGGRDYIVKTIACDDEEERCVAASYECFIALLSDKRIAAGTLRLPRTLVIERGGNLIFERAYYISPNEMRGFSFAVPRALLVEENGTLRNKRALRLVERSVRQQAQILVLGDEI